QLIEINTNAGGALLNAVLARAQRACCEIAPAPADAAGGADLPARFAAMFAAEWAAFRNHHGAALPRALAIVDENPATHFLHPEFELFQQLFRAQGIDSRIADRDELQFADGALWLTQGGERIRIDAVYNRLTDFALDQPASAALRAAWLADAAMITPHP